MDQHSDEQSQVDHKEGEQDVPSSQKESVKHLDERSDEYSSEKPVEAVKKVGQKHREESSDEDDDDEEDQSPKKKSRKGNESSEELKQGLEESDSAGSSGGSSPVLFTQRTGSLVRNLEKDAKSRLSQLLKEGLAVKTEFRELAAKMEFEEEEIDILGNCPEPFVTLLDEWGTQRDSTVENLIKFLREIKRDDVAKTIESGFSQLLEISLKH